jgi:hypothetical protein
VSFIARLCALLVAVIFFVEASSVARAAVLPTFSSAGADATATLLDVYYAGKGMWRTCNQAACRTSDSDWGADSATFTLFLRWSTTHGSKLAAIASDLLAAGPRYPERCTSRPCPAWSDTPSWDAVAFMREAQMLGGDPTAVSRAEAAFHYATASAAFEGGACPSIPYQLPQPSRHRVKTLETDANLIKAGILLYRATREGSYLGDALQRYAADRKYFLDSAVPLYTVHVLDENGACTQTARRFFASVNGNMIWNGIQLWQLTQRREFYDEAIATARAVDAALSDDRGIFVDLQGENDVVEPLVEAMYDLAKNERLAFARTWILRNAAAALSARAADGTFSRFFDGPPQRTTSIWESNGGLALEIAAAGLEPDGSPISDGGWRAGRIAGVILTELPATIAFEGSGIALVGTIGASCETAHLRVFVDGVETFDRTGLWQNHNMPAGNSVRFAWRWVVPGKHTVRIESSDPAPTANVIHLQSLVLTSENLSKL